MNIHRTLKQISHTIETVKALERDARKFIALMDRCISAHSEISKKSEKDRTSVKKIRSTIQLFIDREIKKLRRQIRRLIKSIQISLMFKPYDFVCIHIARLKMLPSLDGKTDAATLVRKVVNQFSKLECLLHVKQVRFTG